MFNRLFHEEGRGSATLPIDATEFDDRVEIRAAVPGIEPEQLNITIERGTLTIQGEITPTELPEGARVLRRENMAGSFQRSLRLSEKMNSDQISAKFKNGLVTITIPKIEPAPAIRVPVITEN